MGILDKIKKKRKIKKLSKFWTIDKSQIEWKDNDKKYNVTLKWSDNTKPISITLDAVSQNFTIADTKDKIQGAVGQLLNEVGEAVVDAVKNINNINSSNLLIALEQFRELVGFIVSKDGKGTNFKLVTQIVPDNIKFDHWTEEYTFPCYKQISQEGCIYFFYIKSIKEYFEKNIADADYINKKISVLEEKNNSRQGDVAVEELIKILKAELEHGNQSRAKQSICQTIAQLKKDLNDDNINEDNFFANITNEKAEAFIKRSYLGLAKIKRICDKVTEFSENNNDNKYRKKMEEVYFYFDNDEVRALEKKCTGRYSDEIISIESQFSNNEPKLNILFQKLRTLKRAVDLATCEKKKDVAKYVEYITKYNNNPNANAVNSINKIANTSIQKRIKKVKIGIVIVICILIAAVLPINIYNQEIRYYFKGGYQYSSQSAEFEFRKYDDSGAEIISAIPTRDDGLVEFPAQVELDEADKYKKNVVAIGSEVFGENADIVKSIIVPANITHIGEKAFSGCSSLESIIFEDGSKLTKIDSNAFEGCSKLEQINIPSSVTEIGENAFSGCSSLTSIIIPDSVTSIGSGAFSGCSGLESITIPFAGGTVKTESDTYQYPFGYIFGNTSYSGSVAVDQYYYGSGASDTMRTTYYIPSSLKNVKVTGGNILYNAFYNCSNLTNIAIPDGVTSIGDYAFYGCSGLINIVIPEGVTSIGEKAFSNCDSIATITIPYSVTSIGEYAFYNCNSLIIYCEKASEPIGWNKKWNYSNCPVVWDNSDIATYYVADNGIRYVINNGAATVIRQSPVLSGEIIIPEEIIYNDITYAVTTVNASAFLNCSSMTSITIPNSVTSIGSGAFSDCSGLTSITIPFVGGGDSKNTHFGYIFGASSDSNNNRYVPSTLKEVVITGGTSIGSNAFYSCRGLTSITIPDSVTSIGYNAFYGCRGLTSIIIPDRVTSIGNYAFYDCNSLIIYCEAASKPGGWSSSWNPSNCPTIWACRGDVAQHIDFSDEEKIAVQVDQFYDIGRPDTQSDDIIYGVNSDLCQIVLSGVGVSDGGYHVVGSNRNIKLGCKMLQTYTWLELTGYPGCGFTSASISNDSITRVVGTTINSSVGYGAVYILITYTDGTTADAYATDIMNGTATGSYIDIFDITDININESKMISEISVHVVYEIQAWWGSLFWQHDWTNWHCIKTLKFI